ncbi:uncharacterized protein LOC135822564 [Sycon ciliatum]|uniref:uncharacterized protein LOC135822564 n=1 Tax=Sycon ciliatum TaxID=27933 RepID=UPI0031F71483
MINPLRRRGCKRALLYLLVGVAAVACLDVALHRLGPGHHLFTFKWRSPEVTIRASATTTHAIPIISVRPRPAGRPPPKSGCNANEFPADSGCRACHEQCVGCAGFSDELCFDCVHSKDGGRCVAKCPKARPYRGGHSGTWCVSRCLSGQEPDPSGTCRKKGAFNEHMIKMPVGKVNSSAAQRWHFDPSVNLDYPKVALTTYQSLDSLKNARLLLPLLPYGPNNQYRGFKESIWAAKFLNRTLVLPPFFNHYSVSLPGHMPASKRHLAERFVMSPQETFDIATLSNAMPVASWQQFEQICGGRVGVEYHCRAESDNTVERAFYFYRLTRLNADHADKVYLAKAVKDWYSVPAQQLVERAFVSPHQCAVLALPYHTLILTGQHFSFLSKHLLRSVQTRQAASIVWQGLLHGQKYIAVHWRFNSEWGRFWCKQTNAFRYNESLVPLNMRPECKVLAATKKQVLDTLLAIMHKHEISYVYMAIMTDSTGLVQLLKKHIKHLILPSHVQGNVDVSGNYALSLVEQEVCSGADVFIGSTKSSWSQNIVDERYSSGKQNPEQNQWWHRIL